MSAGCRQLSGPLNGRMMTSWTFIARSTAAAAKTMVTPFADHGCSLDRAKSGHFTCSRERTDHVLPTRAGAALVVTGGDAYNPARMTTLPRPEFGLFTEFQQAPGMSDAEAFAESMAQMTAAEACGFDAVWLAEIHFQKDRSVLASPLVIAAALAERTRRGKIGIAVQVLPLSHPLHLAEDVATVDHLSQGRPHVGIGRSRPPAPHPAFHTPYAASRARVQETPQHP